MDGDRLYTIGEVSRRTGLPVKTIRFYSDSGVLAPSGRTHAGYRLYDLAAVVRLDLVRTLRELGVDLATIRRVLAREISVSAVAAAHADALEAQIRTLRLRRAVLRAVAGRGSSQEELELMHKLVRLSDEERRRIIADFLDEVFEGLDVIPEFAAKMRAGIPELPDDPSPAQVEAWVELAELVQDPDFRARIRQMMEHQAATRGQIRVPDKAAELADLTLERVAAAQAAAIAPESPGADAVVDELAAAYATAYGETDGPDFRRTLLERMRIGNEPRAERYWQLIAVINGMPEIPTLTPLFEWFITALEARV
ncbi:MerR family transcriptional regulator [Actinomadura sp. NPDC047616]|uniref:MerR family transcriptional regulator n=1 Tax=Actinomadura sp. NPDC047616 TaxID=3155914 RepID=UPI0033D59A6E